MKKEKNTIKPVMSKKSKFITLATASVCKLKQSFSYRSYSKK